ncbi:MAG: hypothetical protein ABIO85_05145 [Sphingomicrobium sp.]
MNMFSFWNDMMKASRLVTETLDASQSVIASRTGTIAAAAQNPFQADTRELTRMVDEKSSAFAKSGAILASDWAKLQGEIVDQAQAIGSLWMSGRTPSFGAAQSIAARSQRIGTRAMASGVRALRPIHATATANQKRLRKR